MATANSTRSTRGTRAPKIDQTIEAARITGAIKCIDVLRSADKGITSVMKMDESVADAFRKKDAALDEIMTAAGPLSPQAAGVLGVLVDFALDSLQNGYSLQEQLDSDWQPETAMTAEEVRIARTRFVDKVEGAAS